MTRAIVLFNLGGPANLEEVWPFLFSLFNDRRIIDLPQPMRSFLAMAISTSRSKTTKEIYRKIGGGSPLLRETQAQGAALKTRLDSVMPDGQVFFAFRHAKPNIKTVITQLRSLAPSHITLLPLYPQFSTTTTGSFLDAWDREARAQNLSVKTTAICCYAVQSSFVQAHIDAIRAAIGGHDRDKIRLLFSAHGLPQRVVDRGDPYQWQIEHTARAIVDGLAMPELDWRLCYQSRVGPLVWIGPSTEDEIRLAGRDRKGVVIVPIAFVSEHSETLVELDIDYAVLAGATGVRPYIRVPALGTASLYMESLATLSAHTAMAEDIVSAAGPRFCPAQFTCCPLTSDRDRLSHG